jgi:hypothetical protein
MNEEAPKSPDPKPVTFAVEVTEARNPVQMAVQQPSPELVYKGRNPVAMTPVKPATNSPASSVPASEPPTAKK